eukprot:6208056-Pleurochrysis_carterae.AAC.2
MRRMLLSDATFTFGAKSRCVLCEVCDYLSIEGRRQLVDGALCFFDRVINTSNLYTSNLDLHLSSNCDAAAPTHVQSVARKEALFTLRI